MLNNNEPTITPAEYCDECFKCKFPKLDNKCGKFTKEQQQYFAFMDLVDSNLPKGSVITGIALKEKLGSTYLEVRHSVPDELVKQNDLWHKNRILDIRLIKGEKDKGLPITSYGVPN